MKKLLFLSWVLLSATTFVSCQTNSNLEKEGLPVDIVFEKWNMQFGQLKSMDVKLSGKNKSGETVEVTTQLMVNQYDEFLLPTLVKLEEADQFKDGNTGSGRMTFNTDVPKGKLFIEKVGDVATENMEFWVFEDVVAVFNK
jgi:hypothetical protein